MRRRWRERRRMRRWRLPSVVELTAGGTRQR
jgi:hypothetical protein